MRLGGAAVGFLAAGCASVGAPPPTSAAAEAERREVQIVEPAKGQELAAWHGEITVPFGVNQNGSVLVRALAERAQEQGAAYLGDLAVIMTFRWKGTPIECRSKVVFADGAERLPAKPAEPTSVPEYGTEVTVFRPRRVAYQASEKDLFCKKRQHAVTTTRRVNRNRGDAEEARLGDPFMRTGSALSAQSSTRTEEVTTIETYDECKLEDVTRPVERYDYEVKLGFVPPNWAELGEQFAHRPLVQAAPECYSIDEAELGKSPMYRLTATAYYKGAVKPAAEATSPVDGLLNLDLPQCNDHIRSTSASEPCMRGGHVIQRNGKLSPPGE